MPNTENAVSSILESLDINLTKNSGRKGRPEQTLLDGTTYEELVNQLNEGSVVLSSGTHWKVSDDLASVVHRLRAALKGKHRINPISVSVTKNVERELPGVVRERITSAVTAKRQGHPEITDEQAEAFIEGKVRESQDLPEVITLTKV